MSNNFYSNSWKKAEARLPKEYKVPEEWQSTTSYEVVGMVNTRLKECEDKQWKITTNGKEVAFRDLLTKTLDWVKNADPALANAAPFWGGLRSLLQLTANETETYGAMLAGLERATWLVSYCSTLEQQYNDYDKYSAAFVEDLVDLYAASLKFLIGANDYYAKNTAVRMSTWVTELTQAINERKARMEDYASLFHEASLADASRMSELFSKYVSDEAVRLSEEREEFMRWLSDVDYRGDHKTISSNILENSGEWMINGENQFRTWKENGKVLWLRGIPGAGKTKLTSTIINHMVAENHTIAYFYCTGDAAHADPEEILRSILKQLIIQLPSHHSDLVKAKYEGERKHHGALTFEDCATFIQGLASDRTVTIVIDALDKCRETKSRASPEAGPKTRDDLLEKLCNMANAKSGNIKVFLSSRDDDDIWHRLRHYPNIIIDCSKNGDNISRYIRSEMDKLVKTDRFSEVDEVLKEELIKAMSDRADGMFLSAAHQIDLLCEPGLCTLHHLLERLGQLPEKLRDLYGGIYKRISTMNKQSVVIAEKTLSWLLCARRQLSSEELLAALSGPDQLQLIPRHLLHLCRHLIVLNEVSNSFELAHMSAREYLETRDEYKDGRPNALVAEHCIKLFELDDRGTLERYASLYWPDHYNSGPRRENDALIDVAKKFFRNKGVNAAFDAWAKAAKSFNNGLDKRLADAEYKPLSVVCVFGFPELLDQWTDPKPESSYFGHVDMVVHLAIKWGKQEVTRLLLQNDSQPAMDRYGWTSSAWAAVYKQQPVLEVLKKLHGNLDAKDKVGWTAVHWMVFLGHMEGLRTLLRAGAKSNLTDEDGWTPLHWAAFIGRDTETIALVEAGHGLDEKDRWQLTPFQWAKFVGNESTAKHITTSAADDSFSPTFGYLANEFREIEFLERERDREFAELLELDFMFFRMQTIQHREKLRPLLLQAIDEETASSGVILK